MAEGKTLRLWKTSGIIQVAEITILELGMSDNLPYKHEI